MASFINKIPGLKNLDMEDPKDRKKAGMILLAVVLVILVLVLNALKTKKESAAAVEPEKESALLEVPHGEDQDILGSDNMLDARGKIATRRTPGNKDIFDAAGAGSGDDPLSFMNTEEKKDSTAGRINPGTVTQEDALRAFGLLGGDDKKEQKTAPAQPQKKASAGGTKRKKKAAPPPPKDTVPAEPSLNEKASASSTIAVRRSGSVSSLDDWGNIEGLSSLDEQEEYITEDEDHPYKVMFTQDQKITSGSRVTLRLLEDMAAAGILIPKNTHLTATCTIGERLEIVVNSIEINGRIYQLGYIAFDIDGSQGLYCPTTESGKKAKATGQAAAGLATSALNTALQGAGTLIGQAARLGASAVTSSSGTVSATVNSGYQFYLLKDKQN